MSPRLRLCLCLLAALAAVPGCAASSVVLERPADEAGNQAVTALWAGEVRRVAQSGDWILSRSYSMTGDVIAAATGGEALSHASIYDAERGSVIEAIDPAVREVPLEHLLHRNHLVIIVRPRGLSQEDRLASVARARAQLGVRFGVSGLPGGGAGGRFYCSDLVLWASRLEGRAGLVVTPSELIDHGEVVYFSGPRDRALIARALERRPPPARQALAGAAGSPLLEHERDGEEEDRLHDERGAHELVGGRPVAVEPDHHGVAGDHPGQDAGAAVDRDRVGVLALVE